MTDLSENQPQPPRRAAIRRRRARIGISPGLRAAVYAAGLATPRKRPR